MVVIYFQIGSSSPFLILQPTIIGGWVLQAVKLVWFKGWVFGYFSGILGL